jgi:hypothetical protein
MRMVMANENISEVKVVKVFRNAATVIRGIKKVTG